MSGFSVQACVFAPQTLSDKTRELDKLRSEWTNQSSCLSSRHAQELQLEREKAAEVRLSR